MENRIISQLSQRLKMAGLCALTAAAALALQMPAEARLSSSERITTSPVYWGDVVVGYSTLVRTPNGISFTYHTSVSRGVRVYALDRRLQQSRSLLRESVQ